MESYVYPIKTAVLTFPVYAFFLTIPFMLYQYRKHRYINKLRILGFYSFVLYFITAYYLIILPLPKLSDMPLTHSADVRYYQIVPFNFVRDIIKESGIIFSKPETYLGVLTQRSFLQAFFNGILLFPLGVYLGYYFKKPFLKAVLLAFGVSLFFEITQLTGLYGIYKTPYRLFDVDDLFLNTLGGVLGWIISPVFSYFLPDMGKIDENIDLKKMQVSFIRRWVAASIDWLLIMLITSALGFSGNFFFFVLTVFLYFIVFVYLTNGKTVGKSLVKIRVKGARARLSFEEVFERYGLLYLFFFGIDYILSLMIKENNDPLITFFLIFCSLIYNLFLIINIIVQALKKDKLLFYEKTSHTRNVIDYKK